MRVKVLSCSAHTEVAIIYKFLIILLTTLPSGLFAAEVGASPTGGVFKMLLGLAIVLAVMAGLAWLLKRMLPGVAGSPIMKVVGGVSVGSRERVVVIEVADRWIVVGVAPGQVNALANIEAQSIVPSELLQSDVPTTENQESTKLNFAHWLKKSLNHVTEKANATK